MKERHERFEVDGPPRLEVQIGAGEVALVAGAAGAVELALRGWNLDDVVVEQRGNTVVVDQVGSRRLSSKVTLTAHVPPDVDVDMKLGSAGFVADATLSELRVATGAGDIRVEQVSGSAVVVAGAGDVAIGMVSGRLQASLASGDLSVDEVGGELEVKTAAGDVRAGRAGGRVVVRSAAGDVDIARFEGSDLVAQSMSGDVRLGIPPGRTLDVDIHTLSGSVRNQFELASTPSEGGGAATLRVKTLSGDVVLRPAQ